MKEPTIPEMLEWLDSLRNIDGWDDYEEANVKAIRAILEQHEELQEKARRWEHHKAVSFLLSKESES